MSANFRYKLRVLSGARFSKLNDVATEINRRCGKSKSSIIRDIYHCYRRFGSGYYDYITYHFLLFYSTRLKTSFRTICSFTIDVRPQG